MTASSSWRQRALALLAALTIAAAVPAAGHAESLVYVKRGAVWISHADGSAARPLTTSANNWAWPSTADDGTIYLVGGPQRTNPDGSEASAGSFVYHLGQLGKRIGPVVATPGSRSTSALPTFAPTGVRVSPNGKLIAFNIDYGGTMESMFEELASGRFAAVSEGYDTSVWLSNTQLIISHEGTPAGDAAAYAVYDLSNPAGSHGPTDDPYLPEYRAVASRDGSRVAVYEDQPDAAGGITAADIQLFAPAANDVHIPGTARCRISIAAGSAMDVRDAGPSFTPDGSTLAWTERDGVHVAATSNLDDCATVRDRLVVPGGRQPFLSGADESIPKLILRSSARRARLSRSGAIPFPVTSNLAATARVRGSLTISGRRAANLHRRSLALPGGRTTRVTVRLQRPALAAVRRALRADRRVIATVALTAKAAAGGSATARLRIRLM